jgi:hypothetical protein
MLNEQKREFLTLKRGAYLVKCKVYMTSLLIHFQALKCSNFSQKSYFTSYKHKTFVTFIDDAHKTYSQCYTMTLYIWKITCHKTAENI